MPQLTREDLKGLSAEQIVAADRAGDLDEYLGRSTYRIPLGEVQLTADDVRQMTPEQLVHAQKTGRLADYLNTINERKSA
jgi:hypothetical protein